MSALDETVQQAIAWRVRLASGTATAHELHLCADWRAADPQHEQAWQRLEHLGQQFVGVSAPLARQALAGAQVDRQRRRALKQLGLFGSLVAAGVLGQHLQPWQPLLAQQRTGTGERRRLQLADGGTLYLNSDTALDIHYSNERRLIQLYQGEILVQTAADPLGRPFLVSTEQGLLRALGTRFQVRQQAHACELAVYQGVVEARPRGGVTQRIEAGQRVHLSAGALHELGSANVDRGRWVDGLLVAHDMPLTEFLAELGRQRPGVLRCASEVAGLRISGVFPLDDSDRVLAMLARTLPVRVVYRTRYWVSLQAT
ncbi:FecR domain-containing protein [Ectopseudomonas toyotomiensis]|uniref:FecR domain-containing protein n=1 Tax=Ectopseudomonas toyotomiensis TaxID=554344 RepID=A0ABD7DYH0_9GAMM|nr:FecR domain-containing protein [Pseudomonas toyotomiensis]QSL93404.1 FecR domain-containing protein [Pseudomonas toyotomiensis]